MKRTPFASWPCSIARTVDLLGDWWTPLVLREASYGSKRFGEFEANLKIGRNILTQRLNRLVEEGLLERVLYQERPERYEYLLTDSGRDFFPVLAAMAHWGDTWRSGNEGPPVVMRHQSCGHATHAEVVCAHCGEPLKLEDVTSELGPGYPQRLREKAEQMPRFAAQQ
ncbi:helix-turn-helix domain-containing protein [Streptomyces sp. NPDC005202]|uniref:winged helix-turn-helix transcriptional regulator n=1 Tax=Streptomyces sp. NPDC005202 TaxID=3157021 RepID=UPI00339FA20E